MLSQDRRDRLLYQLDSKIREDDTGLAAMTILRTMIPEDTEELQEVRQPYNKIYVSEQT